MGTVEEFSADKSTLGQKVIASFTGFGFACATFIFSTIVLVPLTFSLGGQIGTPDWLNAAVVLFEMFGLTAIAGVAGVLAAERGIASGHE